MWFIMAVVMGSRILAGSFPAFTRLMPLIKRLTYGVWTDGAVQVGSASRQKSPRPDRHTSMVEAASPCAPTWAMNRVTFSPVIGCGARWNWEVNV